MTEEQLGRLFNDYYSTPGTGNEKGTGLGLIICKELIGKLGGRLSVKSAAGKGCRVSVILPEN
jgi:signal transduction histidine kinase